MLCACPNPVQRDNERTCIISIRRAYGLRQPPQLLNPNGVSGNLPSPRQFSVHARLHHEPLFHNITLQQKHLRLPRFGCKDRLTVSKVRSPLRFCDGHNLPRLSSWQCYKSSTFRSVRILHRNRRWETTSRGEHVMALIAVDHCTSGGTDSCSFSPFRVL